MPHTHFVYIVHITANTDSTTAKTHYKNQFQQMDLIRTEDERVRPVCERERETKRARYTSNKTNYKSIEPI